MLARDERIFRIVFLMCLFNLLAEFACVGRVAFAASSASEIGPTPAGDSCHLPAGTDKGTAAVEPGQKCDDQQASDNSDSGDDSQPSNVKSAPDTADAEDGGDSSAQLREAGTSAASNDSRGNGDDDSRDADDQTACMGSQKIADCQPTASDSNGAADADDDSNGNDDGASPSDDRPTLETKADYEHDSEHNDTLTTSTLANTSIGDYFVGFRRDLVLAKDPTGSARAEMATVSINRNLSETFAVGGGIGIVRTDGWSDAIGSLKVDANLLGAAISINAARDLAATSAQALRAHLMETAFSLNISDDLTSQLSSEFEFHHNIYSDRNSSDEVQWAPQYSFDLHKTKLAVGYRFDYNGFARNTDHGYWAPKRSMSNDLFAAWTFDWVTTYGRLEFSVGHDSVRETDPQANRTANGDLMGPSSSGFSESAAAAFGFRPTESMMVEFYCNRDESPGWHSTASGITLKYSY